MKQKFFLPIMAALTFAALFTVISCEKQTPIVEEDLNGFDQSTDQNIEVVDVTKTPLDADLLALHNSLIERYNNAPDKKAEIRKINEEAGRYYDEETGNYYFSQKDYIDIVRNPNARVNPIYNEIYSLPGIAVSLVYYYDSGWKYLSWLDNSSVFVNCPSGFQLCSGNAKYNRYLILVGQRTYEQDCPSGQTCCQEVRATFWDGSTKKDCDSWTADVTIPGVNDYWQFRMMDEIYSGPCCFNVRSYVKNGDCNNANGGAGCGFNEYGC